MIRIELNTKSDNPGVSSDALLLALALSNYRRVIYDEWKTEEKRNEKYFELLIQNFEEMAVLTDVACELAIKLSDHLNDQR